MNPGSTANQPKKLDPRPGPLLYAHAHASQYTEKEELPIPVIV